MENKVYVLTVEYVAENYHHSYAYVCKTYELAKKYMDQEIKKATVDLSEENRVIDTSNNGNSVEIYEDGYYNECRICLDLTEEKILEA